MFEKTWDLRDICIAPTIPPIEFDLVDQIFERLIPCSIITPLDCFWEGSKLLGPEYSPKVPYVLLLNTFMISNDSFNS